ncbi:TPA: hypothetical protein ACHYGQ_004490 [Salmonella enterica]|nr:hypothetical protein [Escherichia coli]
MVSSHQYNRNIYVAMRAGAIVLACCFVFIAGVAALYSAKGVFYNPIFHWPAWIINKVLGKTIIPSSTVEFTRLNNIPDFFSLGDMIIGGIYLIAATGFTFYLACMLGGYIFGFVSDYCLTYKLGVEGARAYKKEQMVKMRLNREKKKAVSELESAQHEHWLQWKKFYKSDLSYDEWKQKILNK